MTDVRFRRAVMHAIDRQSMADELMKGQSSVAHAFLNPQEPEYAEAESSIMRYQYDPRAAARQGLPLAPATSSPLDAGTLARRRRR